MKIELDTHAPDRNIIEAYSATGIIINKVQYQNSIIICPGQIIENWHPRCSSELTVADFDRIMELSPELVLLGTGNRLQFPDQKILISILSENIGIEVMDTAAACRAYNFIAGEGRKVVAALLNFDS